MPDDTLETQSPGQERWAAWRRDDVPPIQGRLALVAVILLGLEAVFGIWLRFSTTSLMWLDEALTVNIARLPLRDLHGALKRDGAPPLYYVILHFWMGLVGQSNFAIRSLSGIFSLITVVVVFFVVQRIWGREVALIVGAILLAMPFATYYATEARMYSLVMLLVSLGALVLVRLFERPRLITAALFALIVAALEYTHYWWIYLVATLGVWLVGILIFSKDPSTRRSGTLGIGALVVAGLAFVPWLPTFLYQNKHTGTPWALPPGFQASLTGVLHFYDNQAAQAPISGPDLLFIDLITVGLVIVGIFGRARGGPLLEIDGRSMVRGRFLGWIVFVTLTIGIVGAHLSKSTFVPRYAAVVAIPFIVLLGVGTRSIEWPWLRFTVVGVLVLALLISANESRTTQRTQAAQITSVLAEHAQPGDLVVFCPDQLGPSVMRVLPHKGLRAVSYPRFDNPEYVNWVDYVHAIHATSPKKFAKKIEAVTDGHDVWLVWSLGYGPYNNACVNLMATLLYLPGWGGHQWVFSHPVRYYQSMNLTQFVTPRSTAAPSP